MGDCLRPLTTELGTTREVQMSELSQAMAIGAALPQLQRDAIERLTPLLGRLPIADLHSLADAIEHKGTASLRAALMAAKGERVRVAEWHVVDNRCEHKRYEIGGQNRATHGAIGDTTWLEAWIA